MGFKYSYRQFLFVLVMACFFTLLTSNSTYIYEETRISAEEVTEKKDVNQQLDELYINDQEPDLEETSTETDLVISEEQEESTEDDEEIKKDDGNLEEINEEPTELGDTNLVDPKEEIEDKSPEVSIKEDEQGEIFQSFQVQDPGLIDLTLLANKKLNAKKSTVNGKERIELTYSGKALARLDLASKPFIIFSLPPEIINTIPKAEFSGSYKVTSLLGVSGSTYTNENFQIKDQQVYVELNASSLIILGSEHTFTLNIDLDQLPPTDTGVYNFSSDMTKQVVNLSLLSETSASATLKAPVRPAPPIFNEPIYVADTEVTGTGLPNTTIRLKISGNTYEARVDGSGNFTVSVISLQVGSEIIGRIVDSSGYESVDSRSIVIEAPDTTPPDRPIVNPVYSNESTVSGQGEPGTTVLITIEGQEYRGTVDSEGNFSVPIPIQAPDTLINVRLIDDAGNVSPSVETRVIEATIAFHIVPNELSFQTTSIESISTRIPRKEAGWSLEVIDTRGAGSPFSIVAEATELSSVDGSHKIPDALVFVDQNSTSRSLNKGGVEVYSGKTGNEPISEISWPSNQGPLVEVNPGDVRAGRYTATITWTIVDAP